MAQMRPEVQCTARAVMAAEPGAQFQGHGGERSYLRARTAPQEGGSTPAQAARREARGHGYRRTPSE